MDDLLVTRDASPFAMVPLWVLDMSAQAVKLYAILWGYADNTSRDAWPSRQTLADRMGYTRPRSIDPIIKELEDGGAVSVIRRKDSQGVNLPNRYHLNNLQGGAEKKHTVGRSTGEGGAVQRQEVGRKTALELEPMNYNQEELEPLLPVPAAQPKQTAKAKVAKLSLPVPDPFVVTAELVNWAREEAPLVNQALETPKFVDWHKSKGSRFKDWTAAWRNWMRNAQAYAARDAAARPQRQSVDANSKLGLDYGEWGN